MSDHKKEKRKVSYITQIGTGNYNEKTSRLYTDLSLMTANVDIALEAAEVFRHYLWERLWKKRIIC